jgi:hypothetical protein
MAVRQDGRLREPPVEEEETPVVRRQFTEQELQENAAAFTERFGETAPITAKEVLEQGAESTEERAADRVQVITRGRELMEQEQFENSNPTAEWTLQQFSTTPTGEPWFALQQQNEDGTFRTLTGTREELDNLIEKHELTVVELAPITEGEYYRRAVGDVGLEPEIVQERQEESLELSV